MSGAMRVERAAVILELTCLGSVFIVLPLKFLKDRARGDSLTSRVDSLSKQLLARQSETDRSVTTGPMPTAAEVLMLYRGRPRSLRGGSGAFFEAQEVKAFAERAEATGEFRRMIFPPLDLSGDAVA